MVARFAEGNPADSAFVHSPHGFLVELVARVWKSTRNARLFALACLPLAATVWQPGTSTATGLAT